MNWIETYLLCQKKLHYEKTKDAFKKANLIGKLRMFLTGKTCHDPSPGLSSTAIAKDYVRSFNIEHGLGQLTELGNGRTVDIRMRYIGGHFTPVLLFTYYDGACAFQSRLQFQRDGSYSEMGCGYPLSEFGLTGFPNPVPDDIVRFKEKFEEFTMEIRSNLKNTFA